MMLVSFSLEEWHAHIKNEWIKERRKRKSAVESPQLDCQKSEAQEDTIEAKNLIETFTLNKSRFHIFTPNSFSGVKKSSGQPAPGNFQRSYSHMPLTEGKGFFCWT